MLQCPFSIDQAKSHIFLSRQNDLILKSHFPALCFKRKKCSGSESGSESTKDIVEI